MRKLILITMFALCSSFVFTACASKKEETVAEETDSRRSKKKDSKKKDKDKEKETEEETTEAESDDTDATKKAKTSNAGDVSVEEQEIYNGNDVVITLKGYEYDDIMGHTFKMLIENNSANPITVSADGGVTNGFSTYVGLVEDIPAGKKVNTELKVYEDDLKLANIDTIATFEGVLNIYPNGDYSAPLEPVIVNIKTSVADSYTHDFKIPDKLLYDNAGIKIYYMDTISDDYGIYVARSLFYIENNTDKNLTFSEEGTSVNGFVVEPLTSKQVPAGKKAVVSYDFREDEFTKNGIEKVESLATSFEIYDTDTYDNIVTTEELSVEVTQ